MRLAVLAGLTCTLSLHSGYSLAAQHTFVSALGIDNNECPRSQPCSTLSYASSKTSNGGVLTILDEGDFVATGIGGHITIEGQGPGTRIRNGGLNWGLSNSNASHRLVVRNLSIGADFDNFGKIGIDFQATSLRLDNVTIYNQIGGDAVGVLFKPPGDGVLELRNVSIENTGTGISGGALVIETLANKTSRVEISDSSFDYVSNGIVVKGSGNVQLSVSNTTIAHANKDGIVISPSAGTTKLTIQSSKVVNNLGNGLMLAPTGGAKVNTTIIGSAFDSNVIGIRSFPANPAVSNVSISDTSSSNNVGGVHASGKSVVAIIRGNISGNSSYGIGAASPAAVRIGSSMVNGNALGLSGPVSSYGNNQLLGNTTQGSSTPVPPGSLP